MKLIVDRKKNTRANCYEIPSVHIGLLFWDVSRIKRVLQACAMLLICPFTAFGADLSVVGAGVSDDQISGYLFTTQPISPYPFSQLFILDHAADVAITFRGPLGAETFYSWAPDPANTHQINIGLPAQPFKNAFFGGRVSAASFQAGGLTGLTRTLHIAGYTITVQGGLIVACVDQFGQACP